MNKMVTKLTVLAVATALVAGSALTGCGKKKVDYTLDDGNSGGDVSGGSLSDRLEIPESYSGSVDGIDEATGLTQVSIDAAKIEVPDSDKMSKVYLEAKKYTNEDKKRICESFYDTSAGIYLYDSEHPYKGDVESQIEYWEKMAGNAQSDDEKSSYDDIIQSYKDQLKEAVDEREGAGDYSGNAFVGKKGENEFVIYFYDTEAGGTSGFSIQYNGVSMLSYRPKDGATDASNYVSTDQENVTNLASITKEEAEQKALDFLLSCGITDVVNTDTNDIMWDYYGSDYDLLASETCGYAVSFARSIDGAAPYTSYTWNVDGMNDDDGYVYYGNQGETFEVWIDDNGIYQATCYDSYKFTDDKEDNVSVITWKEALEALPKAINTWYADGSSYSTINFNDVRLSYYMVSDGDRYEYVPVWVFAECETYDGEIDSEYPIHLILLDATTGEFINLNDVLAGQGVQSDSTDDTYEPDTEMETSDDGGDAEDSGDTETDDTDDDGGDSAQEATVAETE